jgi:hypothetical protein
MSPVFPVLTEPVPAPPIHKAPDRIYQSEQVASPAGVPRAYNFNDFGCPASAKAPFDLQTQFPKLSSSQRPTTVARAPKRRDLFAAARRAAKQENITLSNFTLSNLMRSAPAQAVEETTVRRRKPPKTLETLEGGGVDPPT